MKKSLIFLLVIIAIIIAAYCYIRFVFLKTRKGGEPTAKARSILDLRPAIIHKLQELVSDGSNGLYTLSIENIEPDVISSKLDIFHASIHVDSAGLRALDRLQKLPDDIFSIRFDSLHIDGIGIMDLLQKRQIDIKGIRLSYPGIEFFHQRRRYNKEQRLKNDSLTLYERLAKQMDRIAIGKIDIRGGRFIDHDLEPKGLVTTYNQVNIFVEDLLIDSSRRFDGKNFLPARHSTITIKDFHFKTPDSLYIFRAGSISILGDQRQMTILDLQLRPVQSRQQLKKDLRERQEIFGADIPKITLSDLGWWALANGEEFIARQADIFGGRITLYFDKTPPPGPSGGLPNLPDQFLMKLPFPVLVKKINFHHLNFAYEEFNPATHKGGVMTFDNIDGEITNVSNIPVEIRAHPFADFSATCLFMNKVPLRLKFTSDLPKYRTGEFSADIQAGAMDSSILNSVAEPLGMIRIKTGQMQGAHIHLEGNNSRTNASISMNYQNLHITPLKSDSLPNGKLKKKSLTSFIGNTLLIKNSNPSGKGNKPRQPEYVVQRDHRNFINFVWVTILTGILETIGIPVKLVIK